MPHHSLALPPGVDPRRRWSAIAAAHERFLADAAEPAGIVRPAVLASWRRSVDLQVDPDTSRPPVTLSDDGLLEARRRHPLRAAMPLIRRLLIDDAEEAGFLVVVGDADGQILWIDGDGGLRRGAERLHAVAGARWGEADIGTNSIGTALATGGVIQLYGSEHFSRSVHGFSCTGARLHDPGSGSVLGFVNVSGGPRVATPEAALMIRSAVAAIEAELRLARLDGDPPSTPGPGPVRTANASVLSVLGRPRGVLDLDGRPVPLSLRHSEVLFLLATRPEGMTAAELAWEMYEEDAATVTVRAEVSRLRKALPGLIASRRPYQLAAPLTVDASEVGRLLSTGTCREALARYAGPVLPASRAPGVVSARERLRRWIRRCVLQHGDAEALLVLGRSIDGRGDAELWRACLDRLPAGSPRLAEVDAMLETIDREFGSPTTRDGTGRRNAVATSGRVPWRRS